MNGGDKAAKADQELTIVTAFFDIGRAKWTGFERDNSKYIEDFKFWARIKNKLVVYTDRLTAERVLQIREAFGLKDRTETVVIDDVTQVDPAVYREMERALSNELAVAYRAKPEHPESHIALYNYVNYLKPIMITDAVQKGLASGMIAWMDFGFNHGGLYYAKPEDFDFLWGHHFSNKIHLFAVRELDETPIFEIVRNMDAYFSGAVLVAPAGLWPVFGELLKGAALSLAACGFADDDQTLQLMAYRERPDIFEIHRVEHFYRAIKDCGGAHLTLVQDKRAAYRQAREKAKKFWRERRCLEALRWYRKFLAEKIKLSFREEK